MSVSEAEHSQFVFYIVPRAEYSGINNQQRQFYEMLPSKRRFGKTEAMAIAQHLILAERTVNKYGFYEKNIAVCLVCLVQHSPLIMSPPAIAWSGMVGTPGTPGTGV